MNRKQRIIQLRNQKEYLEEELTKEKSKKNPDKDYIYDLKDMLEEVEDELSDLELKEQQGVSPTSFSQDN